MYVKLILIFVLIVISSVVYFYISKIKKVTTFINMVQERVDNINTPSKQVINDSLKKITKIGLDDFSTFANNYGFENASKVKELLEKNGMSFDNVDMDKLTNLMADEGMINDMIYKYGCKNKKQLIQICNDNIPNDFNINNYSGFETGCAQFPGICNFLNDIVPSFRKNICTDEFTDKLCSNISN